MNVDELLKSNQTITYFQGIVDYKNCKTIGYEAFSKIGEHNISTVFREAAEQGLLFKLEQKCIRSAIKNAWALGIKGLLFININAEVLNEKQFDIQYIYEKLKKYSLHKEHICIEILFDEISNYELVKRAVEYFGEKFKVAIKIPEYNQQIIENVISLNPSIIKTVYKDENESQLRYLSQYCNASKTLLIAEKIEFIDTLKDTLQVGVHCGQGYFINRPEIFYPKCTNKAFSVITKFNLSKKDNHKEKKSEANQTYSEKKRPISDIASFGETMLEEESALAALKLFHNKPDCPLITVLDEKDRVTGIIPRTYFLDLFSGQYGYGLHAKKKVADLMKTDFLAVDENEAVENVVSAATSRDKEQVYSPVIIVHKKIYKGIVTIKDLLDSIIAIEVTGRTLEISQKNRLLEQQQKMMKRDLKMAEYVQRSFYPAKSPAVDNWEIAFEFRPYASVSGDVYDFYTIGKTLNGVSLFDVSGHGIASALVGILAKSISQKVFKENMDKSLAEVISRINQNIIKEKGSVENYLTGVILRIQDNVVEYVNAGHTNVLVKNKKTHVFADKQNKVRSRFLGIPDLPVEFNSITAKIPSDTYFLIYSDCLTESRNLAGDELGEKLLIKILDKITEKTASGVLKSLLESFDAFTEAVPVKDDLTVVVLKYKG